MRIAHISDCYLPRLGGIEVQVTELTRRQAETGDTVHVITATPGREVREGTEILNGVTVHRVTARLPFELPVHPRTRHNVVPILAGLRPDVVHVHLGVVSPFAWGGIRAAVQVGLPVLVTVHSVWGAAARSGYGAVNSLAKLTRRGVQPAAVSAIAAGRISAAIDGDVEVLITPNGVDRGEWTPAGRDAAGSGDRTTVAFVTAMRLAPRKRAMPLLNMFRAAVDRLGDRRRIALDIAGDGPQRSRLESHIADHGLSDRVRLLGRLSRAELHARYVASDVFIQPSIKESFGLAALEARSTGLPVIARSQTGLTEFVHDGVEGLLAADDAGMARAIERLATDDELRRSITVFNTENEPAQTWSQVLGTVASAYDVAISRQRAPRG